MWRVEHKAELSKNDGVNLSELPMSQRVQSVIFVIAANDPTLTSGETSQNMRYLRVLCHSVGLVPITIITKGDEIPQSQIAHILYCASKATGSPLECTFLVGNLDKPPITIQTQKVLLRALVKAITAGENYLRLCKQQAAFKLAPQPKPQPQPKPAAAASASGGAAAAAAASQPKPAASASASAAGAAPSLDPNHKTQANKPATNPNGMNSFGIQLWSLTSGLCGWNDSDFSHCELGRCRHSVRLRVH